MDLLINEVDVVGCIQLSEDRSHWQALVNKVMNFCVV